jgi:hypothetical protein
VRRGVVNIIVVAEASNAYVLKDITADNLIAWHSRRPCGQDVSGAQGRRETRGRHGLTPGELSALRLMADGKSN